jgi:hypothetical protein
MGGSTDITLARIASFSSTGGGWKSWDWVPRAYIDWAITKPNFGFRGTIHFIYTMPSS